MRSRDVKNLSTFAAQKQRNFFLVSFSEKEYFDKIINQTL